MSSSRIAGLLKEDGIYCEDGIIVKDDRILSILQEAKVFIENREYDKFEELLEEDIRMDDETSKRFLGTRFEEGGPDICELIFDAYIEGCVKDEDELGFDYYKSLTAEERVAEREMLISCFVESSEHWVPPKGLVLVEDEDE